jgi:hypothetical protein
LLPASCDKGGRLSIISFHLQITLRAKRYLKIRVLLLQITPKRSHTVDPNSEIYCSKPSTRLLVKILLILLKNLLMSIAILSLPVTNFSLDHPFRGMTDQVAATPSQRREESNATSSVLPLREPSKEDLELAHQLVGHSKGLRDNHSTQHERDTEPPSSKPPMHVLEVARSTSPDHSQREGSQSYAPSIPSSDAVPSGQVCRYLLTIPLTMILLTYIVIVEPVEPLFGGDHHRELQFVMLVVFIKKHEMPLDLLI